MKLYIDIYRVYIYAYITQYVSGFSGDGSDRCGTNTDQRNAMIVTARIHVHQERGCSTCSGQVTLSGEEETSRFWYMLH